VYYRGEILIETRFEQGLFVWRPTVTVFHGEVEVVCLLAGGDKGGDQQLWHQRLGHLNYGDMDRLKGGFLQA
jgi:hypothetical protein